MNQRNWNFQGINQNRGLSVPVPNLGDVFCWEGTIYGKAFGEEKFSNVDEVNLRMMEYFLILLQLVERSATKGHGAGLMETRNGIGKSRVSSDAFKGVLDRKFPHFFGHCVVVKVINVGGRRSRKLFYYEVVFREA